MYNHKKQDRIKRIAGDLNFNECREQIAFHANNINKDVTSTYINKNRILILRMLLDSFEQYNNQLIKIEKD